MTTIVVKGGHFVIFVIKLVTGRFIKFCGNRKFCGPQKTVGPKYEKKMRYLIKAIFEKFANVDSNVWLKLSSTGLRGLDYKLFKQPCRLNIRSIF